MHRNEKVPEPFSVAQDEANGVVRYRVFGELDLATVPLLESELAAAMERASVLDLEGLTFIDVAGLRAVLGVESRARDKQQKLTLLDGSLPVRRIFELTGHGHLLDHAEQAGGDHE